VRVALFHHRQIVPVRLGWLLGRRAPASAVRRDLAIHMPHGLIHATPPVGNRRWRGVWRPALFERREDLTMGCGFRRRDTTGEAQARVLIDHRRAPDVATVTEASPRFSRVCLMEAPIASNCPRLRVYRARKAAAIASTWRAASRNHSKMVSSLCPLTRAILLTRLPSAISASVSRRSSADGRRREKSVAGRFDERSTTGVAAIALIPRVRQTILLAVRLLGTWRLPIVGTVRVRTEVTYLRYLGHGSLLNS
jgi:hypothetical protein